MTDLEHTTAFKQILSDIKSQSIDLEAPLQNRLARDVSLVIRESGGLTRGQVNAIPLDYSRISRAFPEGVSPPSNVGGAIDLLTRSHFPAWSTMAMKEARTASDPQNTFLEHFQTSAASFVENLGKFDPSKGQMPYFGIYNAQSANTDRVRAEKRQRPAGTFGLDFPGTDEQATDVEWGSGEMYQPHLSQFGGVPREMREAPKNRSLFGIPQQGEMLPLGERRAWRIQQSLANRLPRQLQYPLYQRAVENRDTSFIGLTGDDTEAIGYNTSQWTSEPLVSGDPVRRHIEFDTTKVVTRGGRLETLPDKFSIDMPTGSYYKEGDILEDTAPSVGSQGEPYYNLPHMIGTTGPGQFQKFLAQEIGTQGHINKRPVQRFYSRFKRRSEEWQKAHGRNYGQVVSQEATLDEIVARNSYAANQDIYEAQAWAEAEQEAGLLPNARYRQQPTFGDIPLIPGAEVGGGMQSTPAALHAITQ